MNSIIQVFIPTRNRPNTLKRTIDSVLNQTLQNFEIIISDNSTNDDTEILVSSFNDERLSYVKRSSLQVIEHFNVILDDVSAKYFMIFHDDDVMYTNMLEILSKNLAEDNTIIAVGSNAIVNKNNKTTRGLFLRSTQQNLIMKSAQEVAYQYLIKAGVVPLPSYLYRKEVAENIRFNPLNGGEYCDVAFVMEVAKLGAIVFLAKPLMEYYIHKKQISFKNNFIHRIRLMSYITKTTPYKRTDYLFRFFRAHNIYEELKHRLLNKAIPVFSRRYFKIVVIIIKCLPPEFSFKILIISFISKFDSLRSKLK